MGRIAAGLLLLTVLSGGVRAEDLAPGQRALLLLRVLAYDRNLGRRAGDEVRIAVVFRPGDRASEREREVMEQALGEVAARVKVAGLPVRVKALPFDDAASFATLVAGWKPATLYVVAGLDAEVSSLGRVAQERQAPAVCGVREQVQRGLAVALVNRGERAGVLVNLRAAKAQGADLDAALLALVELVE